MAVENVKIIMLIDNTNSINILKRMRKNKKKGDIYVIILKKRIMKMKKMMKKKKIMKVMKRKMMKKMKKGRK